MKSGPEVNRPREDQGQEVYGEGSPRWRFLYLPYTMLGILGTPVIVRQEMASSQKLRFILLRPVFSVHSLLAAFVRVSSRMRCLHIPCLLNQYAAFNGRKL